MIFCNIIKPLNSEFIKREVIKDVIQNTDKFRESEEGRFG